MTKRHRPSRRVLSHRPMVRHMVWAGTTGVAAVFLAVTGAAFAEYDAYTGSYNAPYVDYSSPTWTKTTDSVVGGSKSTSSSGTSGSSSTSSTVAGSGAATLPAGAVAVTLNGGKGPVYYRDSGKEETNAVGDWTLMKIYARSPLGTANYTQSVGVITTKKEGASFITGDGYIFPDKLPGVAKSTATAQPTSTSTSIGTSTSTSTSTTVASPSTSSTAVAPARVPSDDGTTPPPVIREAPSEPPPPSSPSLTPTPDASPNGITVITDVRVPTDRAAIAEKVGAPVSTEQETAAASLVTKVLGSTTVSAVPESVRAAMVTYVAYGHTPETAKIGSGERASTVERFKLLYGMAPTTDTDFRALHAMVMESGVDIVQVKRAIEAEKKGLGAFRRIYRYLPATTVKDQTLIDAEWKALRIITYGLKPLHRDLAKERTAIRAYTATFGKPSRIEDWDGIRACVYGSPTTCPLLR